MADRRCKQLSHIDKGRCLLHENHVGACSFNDEPHAVGELLPASAGGNVGFAINAPDLVNHPPHYNAHPSGIECIVVTRHMGFNLGNAVKYLWRCDLKKDAIEDLEKAIWYIKDEIELRKKAQR